MTVVDLLGMGSQGREARPDPLGAKPSEGTVPSAAICHPGLPTTWGKLQASLPEWGFIPQCKRRPAPGAGKVTPPRKGWDPQLPMLAVQD